MPYRYTRADGATGVVESVRDLTWAGPNCQGARDGCVVKCEWVEPKKEYRWRCEWDNGETTLQETPPQGTFWQEAEYRDCLVKCERIEVTE